MNNYIEEYLNHLALKGKSPLTVRNYRAYLMAFSDFAKFTPNEITLDLIDSFQTKLALSGISLVTQSYYLITIRGFLKFLRVRKELNVLDPLRIEIPKTRKKIIGGLSEDETLRLLKSAPLVGEYDIRARAILEFLLGSGVRVAELCSLKVKDIDLKEKYFKVTGKGGKERICFVNDDMTSTIKKYLATKRNSSVYLFTQYARGAYNKPISTRSIERLVADYGRKAGITKAVYPHMLRKTFACQLLRKSVDIRYIKDFLGHDSLQTTQLYTKIEQNELEKVYRLANRKSVKNVKQKEQLIMSKESFDKLRGMIGNTMANQNKILKKLEGKEKQPEKTENPRAFPHRSIN